MTYELTTVVLRKRDKQQLTALQNTAKGMIMGLTSIRDRVVEQLKREILWSDLALNLIKRRLNLWLLLKRGRRELNTLNIRERLR